VGDPNRLVEVRVCGERGWHEQDPRELHDRSQQTLVRDADGARGRGEVRRTGRIPIVAHGGPMSTHGDGERVITVNPAYIVYLRPGYKTSYMRSTAACTPAA
jgi:hypothetical protein